MTDNWLDELRPLLPEGVQLRTFPDNSVVNIIRHQGELTKEDVDATRAAFVQLNWTEVAAWVPLTNASWLSDGLAAGVSFRVAILPGFPVEKYDRFVPAIPSVDGRQHSYSPTTHYPPKGAPHPRSECGANCPFLESQ